MYKYFILLPLFWSLFSERILLYCNLHAFPLLSVLSIFFSLLSYVQTKKNSISFFPFLTYICRYLLFPFYLILLSFFSSFLAFCFSSFIPSFFYSSSSSTLLIIISRQQTSFSLSLQIFTEY